VVEKTSFLDVVMPKNIGVPSELLLFRPDLRAQLKRLIAADADIAVAVADRLPSLTLSGGGYYSDSNSYSGALGLLSASLIQPLLDWGARKAEVSRNKALYEEQLAVFSSMYLEALEEVETTIYTQKQQVEYIKRLEYRKDLLDQTVKEAEFQYLQGVSDYLSVLNALVSLHTLERSLVEAKYNLVLYKINLHKALGSTANINEENG
jgi:outer membrane protein TolC